MEITDPEYVTGVENLINGILKATKDGVIDDSTAVRAVRTIFSQTNSRYGRYFVGLPDNVFTNTELFMPIFNKFKGAYEKVQRSQNYFGDVVQGHHGISVSSLEAASGHLPTAERLKFLKEFADRYGGGGTDEDTLFPLSNLGHQSTGRARGEKYVYNAHISSNPAELVSSFAPDQGTWQGIDFSHITDPGELADEFWNQSGSPQVRLAEIAFDQPQEIAFRQALADRLGIRDRDLITKPAKFKKLLKDSGITKDEALKLMQESYGMTYAPRDPNDPKFPKAERPTKPPFSHPALLRNFENLQNVNGSIRFKRPTVGGALGVLGTAAAVGSIGSKAMAGDFEGAGLEGVESVVDGLSLGVLTPQATAPDPVKVAGGKYDPRDNSLVRPTDTKKMGLAVKGGQPVAVPYGSVAGKGNPVQRAKQAQARGSRSSLNIGGFKIPLPELGISEALKINK